MHLHIAYNNCVYVVVFRGVNETGSVSAHSGKMPRVSEAVKVCKCLHKYRDWRQYGTGRGDNALGRETRADVYC